MLYSMCNSDWRYQEDSHSTAPLALHRTSIPCPQVALQEEEMTKNRRFTRVTMVGGWLILCSSLLAQDSRIIGTVNDESGAVIPGASVIATNP